MGGPVALTDVKTPVEQPDRVITDPEKRERIEGWVRALESGEFEQAQNSLRVGDKLCCLGVACDVSGLGEWEEEGPRSGYYRYRISAASFGDFVLPPEVMEFFGVAECGIDGLGRYGEDHLATLNDRGEPFEEIARIIRRELLGEDV